MYYETEAARLLWQSPFYITPFNLNAIKAREQPIKISRWLICLKGVGEKFFETGRNLRGAAVQLVELKRRRASNYLFLIYYPKFLAQCITSDKRTHR